MSDNPANPFARLDTSLLRSTKTQLPAESVLPPPEPVAPPPPTTAAPPRSPRTREHYTAADTVVSRHHGTTVDTTTPRHHDTTAAEDGGDLIDAIRKVVKSIGKEGATLRLTLAEKQQLKELVYTYSRRGKRTSETELIRIATNYILEDYRRNAEASVVARVLAALDS